MKPEEQRLKRLQRLERVRAIAKRTLATETAQAEGTLAQLQTLSDRTRQLADDYAARDDASDGHSLRQGSHFASGLYRIAASTGADVSTAREHANRKLAELAIAERKRAAVEERAKNEEQALQKKAQQPAIGSRKRVWHDT
ncbi:hypothetical protein U8326_01290 [Tsuneonella sp. CC-YZS046]|uniref:hypothetical protein n=1 Tax=Tsuneonella sp. CC-YZS046 TaxID=3042152 RepID=UPI002D77576A|nr:hypothetical protein [Tsuneonella sp. CC-YZS046]WRO66831.1 hypothetical protein U8326_01290 [Tsuneonella sp. CC-YZS046]